MVKFRLNSPRIVPGRHRPGAGQDEIGAKQSEATARAIVEAGKGSANPRERSAIGSPSGIPHVPSLPEEVVEVILLHPAQQLALGSQHGVSRDDRLEFLVLQDLEQQLTLGIHRRRSRYAAWARGRRRRRTCRTIQRIRNRIANRTADQLLLEHLADSRGPMTTDSDGDSHEEDRSSGEHRQQLPPEMGRPLDEEDRAAPRRPRRRTSR